LGILRFCDGRKRTRFALVAAFFLSLVIPALGQSPVERHLAAFERLTAQSGASPPGSTSAAIAGPYDRWFLPLERRAALSQASADDVVLLFAAAHDAFSIAADPRYLWDMRAVLAELERRNIAYRADYIDMYRALVEARQFPQAAAFARAHPDPDIDPLPRYTDETGRVRGPSYLIVNAAGTALERVRANLNAPEQIVVVASPHCHFCRSAIPRIDADPHLRSALSGHTIWLVPQGDTGFEDIAAWNRRYPREAMVCVYQQRDWPQITTWETPKFYVLRYGKVVATVTGWPVPGGNVHALSAALAREAPP
jgi:hypothetical protein